MTLHDSEIALQPTEQRIENVKACNFVSLYANNVGIATTAFDFALIFGELSDITPEKLTVEQRAKIVMSPLHARLMFRLLQQQLDSYEAQFGPINIPAGVGGPLNSPTTKTGPLA